MMMKGLKRMYVRVGERVRVKETLAASLASAASCSSNTSIYNTPHCFINYGQVIARIALM